MNTRDQKKLGTIHSESERVSDSMSHFVHEQSVDEEKIVEEKEVRLNQAQAQEISTNYSCLSMQKSKDRKPAQWSVEEDRELFRNYITIGSKWVDIGERFATKNDNDCKNRFYCCIRKVLKWINEFQKQAKHKKLIKIDSLLTILEIGKFNYNFLDDRFVEVKKNIHQILQARGLIIELAVKDKQEIKFQELETLVLQLTQLKYSLKFINIKRVKKSACRRGEKHLQENTFEKNEQNVAPQPVSRFDSLEYKNWAQKVQVITKIKNQWLSKALQKLKKLKKKEQKHEHEMLLQNIEPMWTNSQEDVKLKDWTLEEAVTQKSCSCILCLDSLNFNKGRLFCSN